jgi:hypothetical protein
LYHLVLHGVTLITSVTFVTHVTSVTSVTCSIMEIPSEQVYLNKQKALIATLLSAEDITSEVANQLIEKLNNELFTSNLM